MSDSVFRPARRAAIAPFIVMDVMEEAERVERAGGDVIHLEVGQPGSGAPAAVLEAAHRSLDAESLGYTVATGDRKLRERIAGHYRETLGAQVNADSIVVTTGASGAFLLAFLSAFDRGARVACTVPGYPCYANILEALDLSPVLVRVDASSGYKLTLDHLKRIEPKPDGIIVASPANPTGSIIDSRAMQALLDYCHEQGIVAIVDEIYQGLVYGSERTFTASTMTPSVFVINSFSKYYCMTGWRLGWMVVPPCYYRSIEVLAQNLAICAPTIAQRAALAAFDARDELEGRVRSYGNNREQLLSTLRAAGVTRFAPADGAFYVYADFSEFTDDSRDFCRQMLTDIQVATTPGIDFDPEEGRHMVRFSYCVAEERVEEACRRLLPYLRALQAG